MLKWKKLQGERQQRAWETASSPLLLPRCGLVMIVPLMNRSC